MYKPSGNLFDDFTTNALGLIPLGIALNVAGALIVRELNAPIFMDVIGTLIVAVLAGPWVGAATGGLYNVAYGIAVDPVYIPYAISSVTFALIAGFMARKGCFEVWWKVLTVSFMIVIAGVLTSVPIDVVLFKGGSIGTGQQLQDTLTEIGLGIGRAVFATSFIREFLDKTFSAMVAFAVYKALPISIHKIFPGSTYNYLHPEEVLPDEEELEEEPSEDDDVPDDLVQTSV